ncbi:uncharacterized protein LOC120147696 [Hibiscus syriacus]|uniref:uncharacterized protein LOC120147696 n=1 Tax=Hibiscus syriacus TaxID=106335 RepID=UPI001924238B|nr:uncharacterized protein LOC120147696 [Hibiscus syriacus]
MKILSSKPASVILLLLLAAAATTAGLTIKELDAALLALQSRGYTLFPNAITTSDLQVRLLSSQNSSIFTLFAPPDSLLFSLDLLSSARLYTFSLFLHVSPHFLSSSDLLALPRPGFIDTLFPNRRLFVERAMSTRNGSALLTVTVDGVMVSVPDLFIGSNLAVHGLDGILVARYGSLISEGSDTNTDTAIAEPPKFSYQTSPANPPEISPPTGSGDLEMVTVGTRIKKDKEVFHGDTTMRTKHGSDTSTAEPPKFSHQTYVSPANPPESLPPLRSGAPEMMTVGTRIRKYKGASHGNHDRGTTMRTKHGSDTAIAEPPKFSHQTYVLPANPMESLPPTGSEAPEIVMVGTRIRKDKGLPVVMMIEALR